MNTSPKLLGGGGGVGGMHLSPAERRSGKTIMSCCSGSLSREVVLDI